MLIHGPYAPPKCKIGSTLHDYCYGDVVVIRKRNGWPLCKKPSIVGRNAKTEVPVLTGALVEAILSESTKGIADHWGVTKCLVRKWREAIAGSKKDVEVHLAILKNDPAALKERFDITSF